MKSTRKPDSEHNSERNTRNTPSAGVASDVEATEEAFSKVLQPVRLVQVGMQNIDRSHGLSGSQLWALWQISAYPGQRVSELATTLHIHPSTASTLVDKLETRGLVRRERRDTDNRVVRLYLAASGIKLVRSIPGPMRGQLRGALRDLPIPVLAGLVKGVSAVLDLMGEPAGLDAAWCLTALPKREFRRKLTYN